MQFGGFSIKLEKQVSLSSAKSSFDVPQFSCFATLDFLHFCFNLNFFSVATSRIIHNRTLIKVESIKFLKRFNVHEMKWNEIKVSWWWISLERLFNFFFIVMGSITVDVFMKTLLYDLSEVQTITCKMKTEQNTFINSIGWKMAWENASWWLVANKMNEKL